MKTNIFILFGILFILNSCEVDCPGFPIEYYDWYSYQTNDKIRFTHNNDTIDLIINEFSATTPYSMDKFSKCECEASAYFKGTFDDNIEVSGSVILTGYDEHIADYNISFIPDTKIHNDQFNFYLRKDNKSYKEGNTEFKQLTDTIINGNEFDNVLVLTQDTIRYDNARIWKIIISKNNGIIQINDRNTDEKWNLVIDR